MKGLPLPNPHTDFLDMQDKHLAKRTSAGADEYEILQTNVDGYPFRCGIYGIGVP